MLLKQREGISQEIGELVRNCPNCIEERSNPQQPLIVSDSPSRPWEKVGIDHFYLKGKYYLLIADYYSRFPELALLEDQTTHSTILHCKSIFARHGIPEEVRSDNGPQFGLEFKKFAKEYGFHHITSSPRFPQSNGFIESMVKNIKNQLKKGRDPYLSLLGYRTAPLENGYSPAELCMNRKLRTTVPISPVQLQSRIPDLEILEMREKNQRHKKKTHFDIHHRARELPHLDEGTRVWVKDLRVPGVVLEDAGSPRSYIVNSPKGILRRNRFHLLPNPQGEKIDMEDEEMESPEMSQCFTSTGDNTTCDSEPRTFQRSPEPVKTRSISQEIGELVRNCPNCIEERSNPQQPLIVSDFPSRPWEKVGIDHFYLKGKYYLLIADYYSRFPELALLEDQTTHSTILHCKSIFARHGIPEEVRSDNGPQFGLEFKKFAKEYGFHHITSSPRFRQSNGFIESMVKNIKNQLKKGRDPYLSLLGYRTAPLENGYSPAELCMNRKLRTTVPISPVQIQSRIPDLEILEMREKNQRHKKKTHFDIHHLARELPHLDEGTRVWVKDLRVPGVVLEDAGSPRSYIVNSPKGILRRNRFHLLPNPQGEKIDMEDEEMESPEMSQCFTSTGDNTTCDSEPRTFQRSPEPSWDSTQWKPSRWQYVWLLEEGINCDTLRAQRGWSKDDAVDHVPIDSPRYLGVTLDPALTFKKHIDTMISKAKNRLKILKKISGLNWGANANISRTTYLALVRPILEYATPAWINASKTNLSKIDRIQASAAKIISGLRGSCPNRIAELESNLLPLHLRRKICFSKFITKKINSPKEHLNGKFIRNWVPNQRLKHPTPLNLAHNSNLLDIPINPKHRTSYPPHKTRNKLICFPHLPDNPHKHETQPELLKALGLQIIEENSSLFDITIFTGGSQLETGLSGSGIAIYKDKILEKISLSHPRHLSVYKSELSAIDTALKDININSPRKIIIYSDSRAAIYTLQSCFSSQEPLLKSIAKSVNRLPANSSVTVQWLPAHVGIPGNELADSLAKAGALGLPEARESTTQLDERDLLRTIKTQCLQEWKSDAAHMT
ncbi:K02A2.6-like, partial [Cordylochernes scorpioides]